MSSEKKKEDVKRILAGLFSDEKLLTFLFSDENFLTALSGNEALLTELEQQLAEKKEALQREKEKREGLEGLVAALSSNEGFLTILKQQLAESNYPKPPAFVLAVVPSNEEEDAGRMPADLVINEDLLTRLEQQLTEENEALQQNKEEKEEELNEAPRSLHDPTPLQILPRSKPGKGKCSDDARSDD